MHTLEKAGLDALFAALRGRGYTLVGPTVRDGAVVLDELASADELPQGWTDEQAGGSYRLRPTHQGGCFAHAVGPQSWKKLLFPPLVRLWQARRNGNGAAGDERAFELEPEVHRRVRYALIGARACELAALAVQDRVFLGGEHVDPLYRARRREAFIVAVHCTRPGGTCFCASMGTGPRARHGYDLALTEVVEGGRCFYAVEAGSERGEEVLAELPLGEAREEEVAAAGRAVEGAAAQMGRQLEREGLKELLYRHVESPRWERVAERCLSCGNCTLVCPTCFCSTVEDATDLTGSTAERWRRWDSCFGVEFSYLHGGSVRSLGSSRYRHWITHKLATWEDQFGTSGCVGCGRCITWCPVGIDITEEVATLRGGEGAAREANTQLEDRPWRP